MTGCFFVIFPSLCQCCVSVFVYEPFTRHLSALLSDTAFHSNSPFLFPPSGAYPQLTITQLPDATPTHAATPFVTEQQREEYEAELKTLKRQEGEVIQSINEILEEVRLETMEGKEIEMDE